MQKQKIILDVDPGVDDSVALIYSFLCKEFDIKLISVVDGNTTIKQGTKNALFITENFAKAPIPVVEGFGEPLKKIISDKLSVHGKKGLGDKVVATKSRLKTINKTNYGVCEAYKDVIESNAGEIKVVCLGPSTNFAQTLLKYPHLAKMINEVIIMGGSVDGSGSVTPYAGFNVYHDPEALSVVLKSGLKKITFSPKELGLKTFVTEEFTGRLGKLNRYGVMIKDLYRGYHDLLLPPDKFATHDLCAVMYLIKPKFFKVNPVDIKLQLGTGKKRGQTLFNVNKKSNIFLIYDGNQKKILREFEKKIKSAE